MRAAGPVRASQGSDARVSLLRALANACLALLAVLALVANPGGAGLLLAVASLLLLAYQGYGSLLQRNQHLEWLYDFTRAVTRSQEVEEIVRAVLEQSSELLRAERAELLLDDPAPGASRLVRLAGGQGGSVEARPVDEAGTLFQVPEGTVAVHPRPIRDPSLRGEAAEQGIRDAVAVEKARLIGRLRMEVAERRIQALYDRLTGLGNRRWFLEELAGAIDARPGGGLAVLLLDLDRFKVINDTLGYDAGDHVLLEVSERLATTTAGTGMVARLGGDEFAVLSRGVGDPAAAAELAGRLWAALDPPV